MANASTNTTWTVTLTPVPSAQLSVSSGGSPTVVTLKGVAYSPCPINGSNGFAPALGDWFWDGYSGTGYDITGWEALWKRDLPNIVALGANTIRVYNMMSRQLNSDGTFPSPWNSGQLFTHGDFLDLCQTNGLYVLAGVALPQSMYWKSEYSGLSSDEITFWKQMLAETAAELGAHPAVLGIIVLNEVDASNVTYCSCPGVQTPTSDCNDNATFWWAQAEAMAKIAKDAAPDKLIGIALHDDPFIAAQASSFMSNCSSIDFWGVNTYQPTSFSSVFDAGGTSACPTPGYTGLTGGALKPVILTEYGFPATSRTDRCDPSTIYANDTTEDNTASTLTTMLPKAFAEALNLGVYYFEYCDEYWNQGSFVDSSCGMGKFAPPNIYTWYGGQPASGFPNGYWDQEGFGVYSVARGQGKQPSDSIWCASGSSQGPCTPIDVMTKRSTIFDAIQTAYKNVP